MIAMKYSKLYPMSYISHLDEKRAITRALRRMGCKVNFSSGFNPHILMYFTPPLPIGTESIAEYFTLDTNIAAEEFIINFNEFAPNGIKILCAKNVEANPNYAAVVHSSTYLADIECPEELIKDILSRESFVVQYKDKVGLTSSDIRDRIISMEVKGGKLLMHLLSGNPNLRADRVVTELFRLMGIDSKLCNILRLEQFDKLGCPLIERSDR